MNVKKQLKKSFLLSPAFVIPFTISNNTEVNHSDIQQSFKQNELIKYLPVKEFVYKTEYFTVLNDINIVSSELDQNPFLLDFKDFLEKQGFNVSISNRLDKQVTNIVLNLSSNNDLFAGYDINNEFNDLYNDEYFIEAEKNHFFVQTKDQKATAYALNDLKSIFLNLDNKSFKNFKLHNYFDITNRIVYDANNSSLEDLEDNLKNAASNKFNKYVYLNPDETNWRKDYTSNELNEIKTKVELANKYNLDFIYALDILSNQPITDGEYYEFDFNILKTKIQQLTDLGVSGFAVVVKNTAGVNYTLLTRIINELSEFLEPIQKDLYYFTSIASNSINTSFATLKDHVTLVNYGATKYGDFDNEFIEKYYANNNKKSGMVLNWASGYNEGLLNLDVLNNLNITNNSLAQSNSYTVALGKSTGLNKLYLNQFASLWYLNSDNKEQFKLNAIKNAFTSSNVVLINAFNNVSKHIINTKINNSTKSVDWSESSDVANLFDALSSKYNDKSFSNLEINDFKYYFEVLKQDIGLLLNNKNSLIVDLKPWLEKLLLISQLNLKIAEILEYFKDNLISRTQYSINEAINLYKKLDTFKVNEMPINGATKMLLPKTIELLTKVYGKPLQNISMQTTPPVVSNNGSGGTWFTDGQFTQADTGNLSTTGGRWQNIFDTDPNSEWVIKPGTDPNFPVDWFFAVKYPSRRNITTVLIEQAVNHPNTRFTDFSIEYYDYSTSSWKAFSSHHLGNAARYVVGGWAPNTDKIRVRNHKVADPSWRIGTILAAGENSVFNDLGLTAHTANLDLSTELEGNNLENIVDNNSSTYARLTHKGGGNIRANDSLDILFPIYKEYARLRLVQEPGLLLKNFKIQKIVNGEYTDLGTEFSSDNEVININIPQSTGKLNGIRIIATQNSDSEWGIKSAYLFDKIASDINYTYTSNQVNQDNFIAEFEAGKFTLNNKSQTTSRITLQPNEIVGLDFKKPLLITKVNSKISNENIKYFYSHDGYRWIEIADINNLDNNLQAKYFGFKNSSEQPTEFTFSNLEVVTEDPQSIGKVDSSTVPMKNKANEKFEFDNDFDKGNVFVNPKNGQYIIYDLGKEIDIESLRIYASNKTEHYPRNLSIQLSNDKLEWRPAFAINDKNWTTNTQVLGDTIFGLFDEKHPDYRYWGNDKLNIKSARFVRLNILANYPANKDLEISEIVINNQKYNNVRTDVYEFTGSEVLDIDKNKKVENLTQLFTDKNDVKKVVFSVNNANFTNKNLVIFTDNPVANAFVKLEVIHKTSGQISEIILGELVLNLMNFTLPNDADLSIQKVIFTWQGENPLVQSIYLTDSTNTQKSTDELNQLMANIPGSFESWSDENKTQFNTLRTNIVSSLKYEYLSQETIVEFKKELSYLLNKYSASALDTSELSYLTSQVYSNKNSIYTEDSYNIYLHALENGRTLLANKTNLNEVNYNQAIQDITKARLSLTHSFNTKATFFTLINKYNDLDRRNYTNETLAPLDELVSINAHLVTANNIDDLDLDTLSLVNNNLFDAFNKLKYNEVIQSYKTLEELIKQAKKLEDSYKEGWNDPLKELRKQIESSETDLVNSGLGASNNANVKNSVTLLEKAIDDFKLLVSSKREKLKKHLDDPYINMSHFFIKSTADAYASQYSKAKLVYENEKAGELEVENATVAMNNARLNLEVSKDYFNYLMNSVENKDVKSAFKEKMTEISSKPEVLQFLQLVSNYITPSFYRPLEAGKSAFIKQLAKYKNQDLVKELSYNVNRTYTYESFEQAKNQALEKLDNSEKTAFNKTTITPINRKITLGFVFAMFATLTSGFLALYWFKIRKKKQ